MFRLWAKIWKDNRLLDNDVICNDNGDTRTRKILDALETFCYTYNLGQPIWLDSTIHTFKHHNRVRFSQDNFMEEISFDYLEIEIIEED
ncbi:MAG: hypothetical protein R3Y67_09500 [Eubacteriales bacterium]